MSSESSKNAKNSKKLATSIDLSKIPIKEVASKTIEADLYGDGETKSYRIHALNDAERLCIGVLSQGGENVMFAAKFYVLLLTAGMDAVGGNQSVAEFLLANRPDEAKRIGDEIFQLTREFYAAKEQEAEEAEKNSESGAASKKPQQVAATAETETNPAETTTQDGRQ